MLREGCYGTALQIASERGSEAIVKMLIGNGADVNAQDVNAQGGCHGSALQIASRRGSEAIVKMLIGSGADVNAQGGFSRSAAPGSIDTRI